MDVRNLIFPMTAGDLVESALVLAQVERGDGPDMRLLEVVQIKTGANNRLSITLRDRATFEQAEIELNRSTSVLVSNISRS
jgi:hypothetical protein